MAEMNQLPLLPPPGPAEEALSPQQIASRKWFAGLESLLEYCECRVEVPPTVCARLSMSMRHVGKPGSVEMSKERPPSDPNIDLLNALIQRLEDTETRSSLESAFGRVPRNTRRLVEYTNRVITESFLDIDLHTDRIINNNQGALAQLALN